MPHKSPYNFFAPFYDEVVGDRSDVARYLLRLIRLYAPSARSVLELGCGSGTMLRVLSRHYQTTGVDNSSSMLKLARRRAPKAKLRMGDIRDLSLAEKFDVVVCPFDTMNHITSRREWDRTFRVARRHLKRGGVFIFDVNTRHKMMRYCNEPVEVQFLRDGFSMVSVRHAKRDVFEVVLSHYSQKRRDIFERRTLTIRELILPLSEIRRRLARAFSRVTILDPEAGRVHRESEEVFFIASSE
jgi:SAM-dependent methyltransferase